MWKEGEELSGLSGLSAFKMVANVGAQSSKEEENDASSVTLIFYHLDAQWWTEPTLNLIAAAAQMSPLTHVEVALGEAGGNQGELTNVLRIFNVGAFPCHTPAIPLPCPCHTPVTPLSYDKLACMCLDRMPPVWS